MACRRVSPGPRGRGDRPGHPRPAQGVTRAPGASHGAERANAGRLCACPPTASSCCSTRASRRPRWPTRSRRRSRSSRTRRRRSSAATGTRSTARVRAAGLALVEAGGRLALVDAETHAEQAAAPLQARGGAAARRPTRRRRAARSARAAHRDARARRPSRGCAAASCRSTCSTSSARSSCACASRSRRPSPATTAGIALPARLHVIGVLGYDRELREVSELLGGLGLVAARRPVQDDAVAALGGSVGGVSSKLRLKLDPADRADAAAAAILRRLLETIEANLPGTLADTDSEFLHDLRVAVRRTRALQRELRGVFAPEPLRAFRDGFKELQRITGATRDLDVQLLEFAELDRRPAGGGRRRRRAAARAARGPPRRRAPHDGPRAALRAHGRAARELARVRRPARRLARGRAPRRRASRRRRRLGADRARSTAGW